MILKNLRGLEVDLLFKLFPDAGNTESSRNYKGILERKTKNLFLKGYLRLKLVNKC